jgi:hypothetical protein
MPKTKTVALSGPEEKRAFRAWCWVRGIKVPPNASTVDAAQYKIFRKNENAKAGYGASQNE